MRYRALWIGAGQRKIIIPISVYAEQLGSKTDSKPRDFSSNSLAGVVPPPPFHRGGPSPDY